jgi:hypothetical protein
VDNIILAGLERTLAAVPLEMAIQIRVLGYLWVLDLTGAGSDSFLYLQVKTVPDLYRTGCGFYFSSVGPPKTRKNPKP